jgi:hypothetical protein
MEDSGTVATEVAVNPVSADALTVYVDSAIGGPNPGLGGNRAHREVSLSARGSCPEPRSESLVVTGGNLSYLSSDHSQDFSFSTESPLLGHQAVGYRQVGRRTSGLPSRPDRPCADRTYGSAKCRDDRGHTGKGNCEAPLGTCTLVGPVPTCLTAGGNRRGVLYLRRACAPTRDPPLLLYDSACVVVELGRSANWCCSADLRQFAAELRRARARRPRS